MGKFTSNEISKVVFTLVGDIKPTGDSAHDRIALANVETLIELAKDLYLTIDNLAHNYSKSQYNSERNIGERCEEYLDWHGIEK